MGGVILIKLNKIRSKVSNIRNEKKRRNGELRSVHF